MDTVRPFVGKHSPRVKLDGSGASRHSTIRTASGPREVVRGPGVSRRRPRRQSGGPAGLGTRGERLADHIDSTALARVSEVPDWSSIARGLAAGAPRNRGHRQRRVPHRDSFLDACRQYAGVPWRHGAAVSGGGLQDAQMARRQLRIGLRLVRRYRRYGQASAAPPGDVEQPGGVERRRHSRIPCIVPAAWSRTRSDDQQRIRKRSGSRRGGGILQWLHRHAAREDCVRRTDTPEPFNVRLWCIGNEMYGPGSSAACR